MTDWRTVHGRLSSLDDTDDFGTRAGRPSAGAGGVARKVVREFGTPTYAYDLAVIKGQVGKLQKHLPRGTTVAFSLKANASLGLAGFLARCGVSADVASAGELATATAAGFAPERIFVSGPDKSPAMLGLMQFVPEALSSVDSLSELCILASLQRPQRAAAPPAP